MTIQGEMPDGRKNDVRVRVVSIPAFLCLKAFALEERVKKKDAYDIWFCLRHFAGGPSALAGAVRPLLTTPQGQSAIQILRSKFQHVGSVGPQWAADVASGQGADRPTVIRDAFERFKAFNSALASDRS